MKARQTKQARQTLQVDEWELVEHLSPKIKTPVLIEGMPGIGNVGKISMDILIEETKAVLIMSFYSKHLPNSVFVNEENLVDLPKIELYYKRIGNQDYLFLTGDAQPVSETASYSICEIIVKMFKDMDGKHMLTLGGIGLNVIPEQPKVYITGTDKKFVEDISVLLKKKKSLVEQKIYGMVGPIIGISGLLLGIAKKHSVKAYCLLSETFGHPMYVGLKGAKVLLAIIISQYDFGIRLDKLDKEIKIIDEQSGVKSDASSRDISDKEGMKYRKYSDVNYIG